MKKFRVKRTEIVVIGIEVEANNAMEAEIKAKGLFDLPSQQSFRETDNAIEIFELRLIEEKKGMDNAKG